MALQQPAPLSMPATDPMAIAFDEARAAAARGEVPARPLPAPSDGAGRLRAGGSVVCGTAHTGLAGTRRLGVALLRRRGEGVAVHLHMAAPAPDRRLNPPLCRIINSILFALNPFDSLQSTLIHFLIPNTASGRSQNRFTPNPFQFRFGGVYPTVVIATAITIARA